MAIFEVIAPGVWLDYPDRQWAWETSNQLRSLESHFYEANTALNLFTAAQAARPAARSKEQWVLDRQLQREHELAVERERGGRPTSLEELDDIRFEGEVRFKREQWTRGRVPSQFEYNLPFIYARAFLYALDAFDKFLGVLARTPSVPAELQTLHAEIRTAFPHLRAVRNSAQHLEDRARGLGADGKPMQLKPIVDSVINAPGGGVLILNSLNGSRYTSTVSDGSVGEVDVSEESMRRLQSILQRVLDSFRWRGPKQHGPRL